MTCLYNLLTSFRCHIVLSLLLLCGMVKYVHAHHPGQFHVDADSKIVNPDNRLRRKVFTADREHIKEHLQDMNVNMDLDSADDDELHFHYFLLHDSDENKMLDGLELYYSVEHSMHAVMDRINTNGNIPPKDKLRQISLLYENIETIVDLILDEDDRNDDGYLSYPEFIEATHINHLEIEPNATLLDILK